MTRASAPSQWLGVLIFAADACAPQSTRLNAAIRSGAPVSAPLVPGVPATDLVYDERLRRTVLVSGAASFPSTPDSGRVWSWTGARWEPVSPNGPPTRLRSAAVFDSHRNQLVMFGGVRPQQPLGDAWIWASDTWRKLADTIVGPRDHHVMAYDAGRQRVVLFGGSGRRPAGAARRLSPTDVWEWDGAIWSQYTVPGPEGRGRSAMVYDEKRREVVLFGGWGEQLYDDTWIWNGERWRKVSGKAPPARYAHVLAFDSRRGVVVLYGGATGDRPPKYFTDMWEWNGSTWTEVTNPANSPGPRYSPAMAYDKHRRRLVLYGGMAPDAQGTPQLRYDTWEWDGRRWRGMQ